MALPELRSHVQEQMLSNPLLELQSSSETSFLEDNVNTDYKHMNRSEKEDAVWADFETGIYEQQGTGNVSDTAHRFLENLPAPGEGFTDILHEQLIQFYQVDSELMPLCEYLILCLSENGYLEFDLAEIACELRVPLFQIEQALYVVQSLQPAGVGARSLAECLMLQLAQSKDFNARTIRLVKEGLPLLAKNDIIGIAKWLGCEKERAQQAADAVRRLNPIPSRGYNNQAKTEYQIPEAKLWKEQGQLMIEMNHSFMPPVCFSVETSEFLKENGTPDDLNYLKKQSTAAKQLIQCVEHRSSTIEELLKAIVRHQEGFFYKNEPLQPMTMGQLSVELQLNVSTVSRALQNKTILFNGKSIQLKNLFTSSVTTAEGSEISSNCIKKQIKTFVQAENAKTPLSDENIRMALAAVQIPISRRTVAKYRQELGIPSSSERKKR